MLLFKTGLSRLKGNLSLISQAKLLFPFDKTVNFSNNGILLRFKRWSQIALSFDSLVLSNVKSDITTCSPDLTLRVNPSRHNR